MAKTDKVTPMMRQYLEIKKQYQDAFLFYRIGDFYELFYDDAKKAAPILELTLTCRNKNVEDPIPMCGVPHHSAQKFIDILIDQGYKVAICEQVEDAKDTKPNQMVKREVIQVITPGTNIEIGSNDAKINNYLVALYTNNYEYNLCYADLSTGEFKVTTLSENMVVNECNTLQTKEIVLLSEINEQLKQELKQKLSVVFSHQSLENLQENHSLIQGLKSDNEKITVLGMYNYLLNTQKRYLTHLQEAIHYEIQNYLKMDYDSKYNLELTKSIRTGNKQGTLLSLLDETNTAMGGRLLKQWIDRPLINLNQILERQNQVDSLINSYFAISDLKEHLKKVYDLERLVGKISLGTVNARDLIQLKNSLQQIPYILDVIVNIDHGEWTELLNSIDRLDDIVQLIEDSILEESSLSITEGNIIKPEYNEQLSKYIDAMHNGRQWLADLEARERELTGISKLKIGFNKVFGYYLEASKTAKDKIPEDRYERKQTLSNSERFTTKELKEIEKTILEAEDKSQGLEYTIFVEIRDQIKKSTKRLQKVAKIIAKLDVLQSFATVSDMHGYVKPTFNNNDNLEIIDGRHPVVETVMEAQEYVANSIYMNKDTELLLITGPNMSGKSTYMRQLALMVIMAQMGCFVPCSSATMPIFDQIFTRIGASDNLISGQSTFMVEMMEANNALINATPNSLILFDELGRGTSTYDGMALAQSIIEYIHDNIHAKTLFSTHYHELTVLEDKLSHLKNIHVEAVEQDGKIIFMHKIENGPADKSYGVHVARLAGLPNVLLNRADELLKQFEEQSIDVDVTKEDLEVKSDEAIFETEQDNNKQMSLFVDDYNECDMNIIKQLKELDLMNLTPLQAFQELHKLQQQARKE